MGAEEPVRLAVLGDIVVSDGAGAEMTVAPQRLRILAALAAAAGSVVPRSALLHDVWGSDTETTRQRLKTQIAQIRSILGGGLGIEFRLDGYRLTGALDQLDSTLFESLVTGARSLTPAEGAPRYRQALALWRGPVSFGGVDSLLVDEARRRLETLRDETTLALGRCEVALGRPGASMDAVRAAFDDDPSRGDVAVVAAALLALGGRQAESLRLVERHRAALIDIGLDPSQELIDLELRILRHELGPSTASPVPPAATPDREMGRLVARPAVEERIVAELSSRPVVLWGEAGVGKSILAGVVAELFTASGCPLVRLAARPDPTRPMDVVAGLIEQLLGLDPELAQSLLTRAPAAAAVSRLTGLPAPAGTGSSISRDELIVELTGIIMAIAGPTGCLVVVDDVHWLDNSSAEIVGRLIEDGPVRLVATSRRAPVELFGPTWAGAAAIEVPAMTIDEVGQLLHQVLPVRATDDLARRLHERTGGNGLFLRLELDLLADGIARDLQPTVFHAVHQRTAGFSRATREILQTAALLGRRFPLEPLAAIHPNHRLALADAVDEGIVLLDPEAGTGSFVHGLVVDAFVELQPPAVRVTRHDRLWGELRLVGASPAALAKQALGAAELDPERAVEACRQAAIREAEVFEWAATVEWARTGLRALERAGITGSHHEAELGLLLGLGLRRLNRAGSNIELLTAADQAETLGDHSLYVRCVIELCLHGGTTRAGTVDDSARRHLERALGLPIDRHQQAELMSAAATLMAISDETSRGRALYRQARSLAEETLDPLTRRTVLLNAHLGLAHPDDLGPRRRAAEDLAQFDDHEAQWESRYLRFGLALIDADRAGLDQAVAELRTLTANVRQRDHQQSLRQIECVAAFVDGRIEEAGDRADDVFASSLESFPLSWTTSIYTALVLPVREAQGRSGELLDGVTALIESSPEFMTWHAAAAAIAYAAGNDEIMARELAVVAGRRFDLVADLTFTAVATVLCRPVWAEGDPDRARLLYDRLEPYSGLMAWNGLSTHGPVDGGLALLATVLGRSDAADHHLERCRAMVDRLGAPHLWWPELGRLAQQGHPDAMPHRS